MNTQTSEIVFQVSCFILRSISYLFNFQKWGSCRSETRKCECTQKQKPLEVIFLLFYHTRHVLENDLAATGQALISILEKKTCNTCLVQEGTVTTDFTRHRRISSLKRHCIADVDGRNASLHAAEVKTHQRNRKKDSRMGVKVCLGARSRKLSHPNALFFRIQNAYF